MSKLKDHWGDGRDVQLLHAECEFRSCLRVGEDKGSFTQGVGYTSYYKNPELVCMHNHLHGCPSHLPDVDPERARCCRAPDLPPPRGQPYYQTCRRCKTRLAGLRLKLVRTLPLLPCVDCRHEGVEVSTFWEDHAKRYCCPDCNRYFNSTPEPFEPGMTSDEVFELAHRQAVASE